MQIKMWGPVNIQDPVEKIYTFSILVSLKYHSIVLLPLSIAISMQNIMHYTNIIFYLSIIYKKTKIFYTQNQISMNWLCMFILADVLALQNVIYWQYSSFIFGKCIIWIILCPMKASFTLALLGWPTYNALYSHYFLLEYYV